MGPAVGIGVGLAVGARVGTGVGAGVLVKTERTTVLYAHIEQKIGVAKGEFPTAPMTLDWKE